MDILSLWSSAKNSCQLEHFRKCAAPKTCTAGYFAGSFRRQHSLHDWTIQFATQLLKGRKGERQTDPWWKHLSCYQTCNMSLMRIRRRLFQCWLSAKSQPSTFTKSLSTAETANCQERRPCCVIPSWKSRMLWRMRPALTDVSLERMSSDQFTLVIYFYVWDCDSQ